MTLTVETGTGASDADALFSLAYADAYHAAQGNTDWAAGAEAAREVAIRRASAVLTDCYRWKGYKVNGRDQAMAWPRSGVLDGDGYGIGSDEIPVEIMRAGAEIALRELAETGAMTPDYTPADRVKSETFGRVSFEYDLSRKDADSTYPVLRLVRDLIGPFLCTTGGNRLSGTVARG